MTGAQRELKQARDKRYREKKRRHREALKKVVDAHVTGATIDLEDLYVAGVLDRPRVESREDRAARIARPDALRKEGIARIRTELRLRHRVQADQEICGLEAAFNRRMDDCMHLGIFPEVDTFENILEFSQATRRQLFELAGQHSGDIVEYAD
jgi:hypothetical protein